MSAPTRIRALFKDGVTEVRALLTHPMENGQRRDAAGQPVAAHYITEVRATVGERTVLSARWGTAVSQNPYLQFRFRGAQPGDKVTLSWQDNRGDRRSDDAVIA